MQEAVSKLQSQPIVDLNPIEKKISALDQAIKETH
jgi:hypothetical protein